MSIEERAKEHVKGIENIFIKTRAESLQNLEKEMIIQVQKYFRTPTGKTRKEPPYVKLQLKYQAY